MLNLRQRAWNRKQGELNQRQGELNRKQGVQNRKQRAWILIVEQESWEQVLILMGTPSTVATVSGEVFYYISQRAERRVAFMQQDIVDQRVIAVYFDRNRRVERLANYGVKDGKVFDYVSRTTPTGGEELSMLGNIFGAFKIF